MSRMKPILGYTAGGLTIVAALLTPFLLMNVFVRMVAATGVRIDPAYVPTEVQVTLAHDGYFVTLYKPVLRRNPFSRTGSFAQVKWTPVGKLPPQVAETLDLNADGKPDAEVRFAVPRDPNAPLRFNVKPIGDFCREVRNGGEDSFSQTIVRTKDAIVARIPLRER